LRSNAPIRLPLLLVLAGIVLTSGCQTARVEKPLTHELGGNDPNEQLEFWQRLADQPVTSNDDAFHGLLLFLDGGDPASDYAGRVQTLKSRKLLPQSFNQPAEQAVSRGTLAVALVKMLDIKGGLMLRLLGPNPRYAVRELVFMELYPPSSPHQTFSGVEFLGIIAKAEDYQRQEGTLRASAEAAAEPQPETAPAEQPAAPGEPGASPTQG
jgi:hypothetical protein